MDQIKRKGKIPMSKHSQQVKHTFTIINNPQKTGSQFQIRSDKIEKTSVNKNINDTSENVQNQNKNINVLNYNSNYNQTINGVVSPNQGFRPEEDDPIPTDDIPNTTEEINKLHINSVKTNNLHELNVMYRNNYNQYNTVYSNMKQIPNKFNMNTSNYNEFYDCNEEFGNADNLGNRDLSKKTINPKFIERNNNTSTRFSTNDSNESSDSGAYNKFGIGGVLDTEKYSYNTPVFHRNYPHTPIVQNPQGKRISFGGGINSAASFNNLTQNQPFMKSSSMCIPGNINYNLSENNFYFNGTGGNLAGNFANNKVNLQNLPENAFSYNLDNPLNPKSLSEKKKKKSKDEVDQTLFVINTDNIIRGMDKRTTIMIRHIPNKYSTQSLLEEINVHFKGKYDFFYLPMDFEVVIYFYF